MRQVSVNRQTSRFLYLKETLTIMIMVMITQEFCEEEIYSVKQEISFFSLLRTSIYFNKYYNKICVLHGFQPVIHLFVLIVLFCFYSQEIKIMTHFTVLQNFISEKE